MKNFKTVSFALLIALSLASCSTMQDTPQADSTVNPLINADGAVTSLDDIGIVPCGAWETVVMVDERGNETGTIEVNNDEDNFYFYMKAPSQWQILAFAAHGSQADDIPQIDGEVDYDAFQQVVEFDEPSQTTLIIMSRREIQDCSSFAITAHVQFVADDATQEAMEKVIFIDGVDIFGIKAFKYCAQGC